MEIELTMPLPWIHFKPASMTSHLDESTITGTRAISGSEAIKFRKRVISFSASNKPSSIFTSMTCAPPSTCSNATAKASVYCPSLIKRLNLAEPVTLVRSPTLTNKLSLVTLKAWSPDKRNAGSIAGSWRGAMFLTASAMALICAGVEPQQPPTIFKKPFSAHSLICAAIWLGDIS